MFKKKNKLIRFFVTIFLFSISTSLLSPLFSPYLREIGLQYSEIGLMLSLIPLVIVITSPLIGRISDKFGRIRIIFMSFIFYIIALILYLQKKKILLITANVFIAITVISADFLLMALLQDLIRGKKRGTYSGYTLSIKQIGVLLGPVIGGYIADKISIEFVFILAILFVIITALFFLFIKDDASDRLLKEDFNLFKNIKKLFLIRQLKSIVLLGFFVQFNNPAINVFLPLLITEELKLGYTKVGFAFFFIGFFFLFQFIFGILSDKMGNRKSIIIGNIITCAALFLLSKANSYFFILLSLSIFSFGGAFWNPAAYSFMAKIGKKKKNIGEVMGFYNSFGKLGDFAGYLVSSIIVSFLDIKFLFLFNGIMIIIGMLLFIFLKKQ